MQGRYLHVWGFTKKMSAAHFLESHLTALQTNQNPHPSRYLRISQTKFKCLYRITNTQETILVQEINSQPLSVQQEKINTASATALVEASEIRNGYRNRPNKVKNLSLPSLPASSAIKFWKGEGSAEQTPRRKEQCKQPQEREKAERGKQWAVGVQCLSAPTK